MDSRLETRLKKISEQIEKLRLSEAEFFHLEAHEKVLFSKLFLKMEGKTVSDREALVYSSDEWQTFTKGLSEAHAKYNEDRRLYELKLKAYDSEHLTFKIERDAILRGVT